MRFTNGAYRAVQLRHEVWSSAVEGHVARACRESADAGSYRVNFADEILFGREERSRHQCRGPLVFAHRLDE